MKIVFLDFDGVLNTDTDEALSPSGELWSAAWLEPALVMRCARAGASVVITSSWRARRTVAELAEMLRSLGFTGEVIGATPRLPRPVEGERLVRLAEVRTWLAEHPDVTAFVILDDDQAFDGLDALHVRTDSRKGLSENDVERALAILTSASR